MIVSQLIVKIRSFHLDGSMADVELITHKAGYFSQDSLLAAGSRVSDKMDAHNTFTTGQSPDMQIVDILDPLNAIKRCLYLLNIDALWNPLSNDQVLGSTQNPMPAATSESTQVQPVKRIKRAAMMTPIDPTISLQTSK